MVHLHTHIQYNIQFSSVQSLSCVQLFVSPWTAACQASLSITNSLSLLKLMSIESVMTSNHLILFYPLLLLAFNLSQYQGLFPWGSLQQVAKYCSFSFSISPSNEYSELMSLRVDWFDLLAVPGTLKCIVQYNPTVQNHQFFLHSTCFVVQLSHPYMTTGKTIVLTRRTFVDKVVSAFLYAI